MAKRNDRSNRTRTRSGHGQAAASGAEAPDGGLRRLAKSRSAAQRRMRDAFESAQATLQTRVGDARHQAQETWDNLEALFQSRVQRAMRQLGVPTAEEIRQLTQRVAELNETVRGLDVRERARPVSGPKARGAAGRARRARGGARTPRKE